MVFLTDKHRKRFFMAWNNSCDRNHPQMELHHLENNGKFCIFY